jgi:hypothetical protein
LTNSEGLKNGGGRIVKMLFSVELETQIGVLWDLLREI